MHHPIHRVDRFAIAGPYTLVVSFADGTEQRIEFHPVLRGPLLGPLRDLATFNSVRLDPDAGTLVWPNGADFDPARCATGGATASNSPNARAAGMADPTGQDRAPVLARSRSTLTSDPTAPILTPTNRRQAVQPPSAREDTARPARGVVRTLTRNMTRGTWHPPSTGPARHDQ